VGTAGVIQSLATTLTRRYIISVVEKELLHNPRINQLFSKILVS